MTRPNATASELPARAASGGIVIHVRVTPKASEDAVLGVEMHGADPVLRIKVRAIADRGEANDAVVAVLAKWLSVPKTQLKVAAGAKARLKQIFVSGEAASLTARLASRLAGERDWPWPKR